MSRLGESKLNNKGLLMTITQYIGATNISVTFEDGTVITGRSYDNYSKGSIHNYNMKSYYGIGYLGAKVSRSQTKEYQTWIDIFKRSYDDCRLPTYKFCSVHPDWHNFQSFVAWFKLNYVEGWHLDKDILVPGNKIYGPDTCCFVPPEINIQFREDFSRKNDLPRGVMKLAESKFLTRIRLLGGKIELGVFETPERANEIYEAARIEKLKELARRYRDKLSQKVYNNLIQMK